GLRDRQGIVAQAEYPDGSTRDVSFDAKLSLDKPVAKIIAAQLAPVEDGKATLTVAFGGLKASVPGAVTKAKEAGLLRFRDDVLPALTRVGCNTGKCHGAASGKDGFRLSLFGYDPDGDYLRVTREMGGRRVNLASPSDSLIVNKALGKVPHTGGQRLAPGREGHHLILRWLERGGGRGAGRARPGRQRVGRERRRGGT